MKNLIFEESIGIPPPPGTVEDDLLQACSHEDDALWDALCFVPMVEIERAVERLRALGWKFSLEAIQ